MLLVGLVVGLLVSIFQAVTQIQEQTLSFIPKILGARRRDRRRRPVDARPARHLHAELYASIPTLVGRMSARPSSSRSSASSRSLALHARARARSRRCSCSRRCSRRKMMPGARARRSSRSRWRSASRRSPRTAARRRLDPTAAASAALMLKELLVGLAFAFALGALFAALQAAGSLLDTLDRLLVRRARRPGHRQPVGGPRASSTRWSASLVFIAIGGDAWVIQGLARTYDAVPLLDAPAHRLARRGRAGRVRGHLRRGDRGRRAGAARAGHHRRRVRRRLARRAAAQRLRGRLPGQGRRRPRC